MIRHRLCVFIIIAFLVMIPATTETSQTLVNTSQEVNKIQFDVLSQEVNIVINTTNIAIVSINYELNITGITENIVIRIDATHLTNLRVRDSNNENLTFAEIHMDGYTLINISFGSEISGYTAFSIFYLTSDYISEIQNGYLFIYYLTTQGLTHEFDLTLRLPKNARLMRAVSGPSIFPTPKLNWTDGSYFYFKWIYHNIPSDIQVVITAKYLIEETTQIQNESLGFTAMLSQIGSMILGILISFFAVISIALLFKRARLPIDLKLFLTENEKRIIKYIMEKGGKANQAEIVWDTKMSKAMVSTVLSSLAKKKLIKKEKLGRINFVTATDKLKELFKAIIEED